MWTLEVNCPYCTGGLAAGPRPNNGQMEEMLPSCWNRATRMVGQAWDLAADISFMVMMPWRTLYYGQAYRKAFCAYDSLWRFGRRSFQYAR